MGNLEANNNQVENISDNIQMEDKLEEIVDLMNQKVESWELSTQERDQFIESWLWTDHSSLDEENNWLIDRFINDTIQKLKESEHDIEMINNITRNNLDNLLSDIDNNDYSFNQNLNSRYWRPEEAEEQQVEEISEEQTNESEEESDQLSQEEIRKTQLENRYNEVTIILRQKIEEAKSLLWNSSDSYSIDLELTESYNLEENINEIEQAIQRVEEDISEIKNNEHELQQEVDNIQEQQDNEEEKVEETENEDTQEQEVWAKEAQESSMQNDQEQIQESLESNEYVVQKWDNLWNITKNHYNLSENSDIVNKINQVIEHQDESKMKQRLKDSNWDMIWVWDKIKLP